MVLEKDTLAEVLSLPREERADLALRILESLAAPDQRTSEEWIAEVEHRARRALAGSMGRDFDEVIAEIGAELTRFRS